MNNTPKPLDIALLIVDKSGHEIFRIDEDGTVLCTLNGKKQIVKNARKLSLAFAEAIKELVEAKTLNQAQQK